MRSIKNQIKKILPVFVFVIVLFGLCGFGITAEEKTYSSTEKRELQTMPKVKIKTLKNGKFQKKYERYLSDQFPERDGWVKLRTTANRMLGKKESNGVYFAKDHYLLEHYDASDFAELQTNIDALAGFVKSAKEKADVRVMMIPTKTWVLRDKLPAFAPTYDEQIFYDALNKAMGTSGADVLIPMEQVLNEHKDEEIYYRTDHHWTTLGAWYGYEAYVKAVGGREDLAKEKQTFESVCTDFYGTTYAKVNQASRPDAIDLYEPKRSLQVVYNMGERTAQTLYELDYLQSKDQYSIFTGGNQAVIEITGGEKNGKTLLLVKDSFANCMLPFLAEDFERIVVVDLRQLNVDCDALMQMFEPTDVLVLYNSAQFAKDREFAIKCR